MHAGFRNKQSISVVSGGGERRGFQTGFLPRLLVDNFYFESSTLAPAEIHTQQHSGPVLSIGAARSGVYRYDSVASIVRTRQQHFCLSLFYILFELFKR